MTSVGRTFGVFKLLDKPEVDDKIHRISPPFILQWFVRFKSTCSFCLFVDSVNVECFLNMVAKTITGKRVYVLPYSHRFFGALKQYFHRREFPITKLLNICLKTAVSWSVIAWFSSFYSWSASVLITVLSAFLYSCMPCGNHGFSCFMKKFYHLRNISSLNWGKFLLDHF